MKERSELQVVTMEPLHVSLGGQAVDIPILPTGKALEWREEWNNQILDYRMKISKPEELRKLNADDKELTVAALEMLYELMVGSQRKVVELVCSYADKTGSEITGKRILDEAWDEEIKVMWERMYEAIFGPLATSLPEILTTKKKSP